MDRPNIVLVMTDDQTVESLRVMRNVRRLIAREGTTFRNAVVSFPVCCPSRATMLTGQYAHNHGVLGNDRPAGGYPALNAEATLAVWLQDAGYDTIHVGKYLNGYGRMNDPTDVPVGWSEWYTTVDPSTYNYVDFTVNNNGRLVDYTDSYQTDLHAERAEEVIRRHATKKAPFFLWLSLLAPHAGYPIEPDDPPRVNTPAVAERHADWFAFEPMPQPPSFNEAKVGDKPAEVRSRKRFDETTIAGIEENYRQQLESLLAVDEAVGRLVAALTETGQIDDTLLVFTSDNGFLNGEYRIARGKMLPYEPSIRVPLILRGPGIPQGITRSQLVGNVDLAPTFAKVSGARPGRPFDGRSLLPLTRDPRQGRGRPQLIHTGPGPRGHGDGTDAPFYTGIRTPHELYVEWRTGEREYYDLRKDPHQVHSKHDHSRTFTRQQELAGWLASLRTCAGAVCKQAVPSPDARPRTGTNAEFTPSDP